jgi:putative ABC transport system ATP-binding protein
MIFSLRDVTVTFDGEPVFSPVSFDLNEGDKIAISGPSGKGKSSLFNVLLGFECRYRGEVLFENRVLSPAVVSEIRKSVGWLPQEISTLPMQTVRGFIYAPFEYQVNKAIRPAIDKIEYWFDALNLKPGILDHPISTVSGGEKQRIGLLTVLLMRRPVLFLDEPVAALDAKTKKRVVDLLLDQGEQTILSTSHDAVWSEHCDKIITL